MKYENMSREGLLSRIKKLERALYEIAQDTSDPGIERAANDALQLDLQLNTD